MSSAASPPHLFFSVPVPHALRAPLALCSPLILHWTVQMDFAVLSQLKKKKKVLSNRDVDSFSAPNEMGNS
jgi:hypothetical protein